MADSMSNSLLDVWSKLQNLFRSPASTNRSIVVPQLKKLNEMVYEVYCPAPSEKPELEIVFFHGLQLQSSEHAYLTTWMSDDNSEMWLQTWLVDAFPKARILTISYNAATKSTNEVGQLDMFCTTENLLSELTRDPVNIGKSQCPIVLVGHCLGGLLLKELCLHASSRWSENGPELPGMQRVHDFLSNLRGMFFYGTPHIGSSLGDKQHSCLNGLRLSEIEILNASTARRNGSFCALKKRYDWRTYGVGETKDTFLGCLGQNMRVVSEASSRHNMDFYYSANANHFDICKPEGKHCSTFTCLRDFLAEIHKDGVLRSGVSAERPREYFVDYEGRVNEVRNMLAQADAQTIFITGLTGIGKTALAKQVFHDISHTFEVSCFVNLDDVGSQSNNREHVLKKIEVELKRRTRGWNYDHFSVPVYLKGKKVLITVDNVQSQSQLDALDREIWLEGSTSRLVVTTTNPRLGSPSNTFEVKYLKYWESEDLFLHHAFEGRSKPLVLPNSLKEVIQRCENFPLSLKILGSYLNKDDVDDEKIWKDLRVRLKIAEEVASGDDYKLWARLRPCYDALTLSEQELFLDVATLFTGWPFKVVEYIWSASRLTPHLGWKNMQRGFLVNVDETGSIVMHGLLRNLGQSIACPRNSPVEKWRRASGENYAKKLMTECQGVSDSLSLELRLQQNERLILRNTTFIQFVKLEYLILDGMETTQGNVELPNSLVYLRWMGGLFETCPVDFSLLGNLVVLDLQHCKRMKFLPTSVVTVKKLKWLELKGCESLTELPSGVCEFSELEYLDLSMTGLTKLPKSLGRLKKLQNFLVNQTKLKRVPKSIGRVGMLQFLNISYTSISSLPNSIGDLRHLISLDARNTLLSSLPDSIGRLGMLEDLDICNTVVGFLPESIGELKSLRILLAGNTLLRSLPSSIGRLQGLEELCLSHSHIECLPESLGDLVNLEALVLSSTPLETLPDSIHKLRSLGSLYLENTQISTLPHKFQELTSLTNLALSGSRVRSLPETWTKLCALRSVAMTLSAITNDDQVSSSGALPTILGSDKELRNSVDVMFHGLRSESTDVKSTVVPEEGQTPATKLTIPSLVVPHGTHITITGKSYEETLLPALFCGLRQVPSLCTLDLRSFKKVDIIPSEIGTLSMLGILTIESFWKLRELPESLSSLKIHALHLKDLPRLCKLPDSFGSNQTITSLEITNCGNLESMPSSWGHRSLLERDPSTSCGNRCATSNSFSTLTGPSRQCRIATNSWRVLRCLLECCSFRRDKITFALKSADFERVREMAVEEWAGGYLTVATKLFKELCLELYPADDGEHEKFTRSTSWVPLTNPSGKTHVRSLILECGETSSHNTYVKVIDIEQDDDEDTEEESESDEVQDEPEKIEERIHKEEKESDSDEDEEIEATEQKRRKLNGWPSGSTR